MRRPGPFFDVLLGTLITIKSMRMNVEFTSFDIVERYNLLMKENITKSEEISVLKYLRDINILRCDDRGRPYYYSRIKTNEEIDGMLPDIERKYCTNVNNQWKRQILEYLLSNQHSGIVISDMINTTKINTRTVFYYLISLQYDGILEFMENYKRSRIKIRNLEKLKRFYERTISYAEKERRKTTAV